MTWLAGPWGWLVSAAGTALKWCIENWRLVAVVLLVSFVLGYTFVQGVKYERKDWEKKEAARLEHEREVIAMRKRVRQEVAGATQQIETKATETRAAREAVYKEIEKEVTKYVERHSQPAAPGACPVDTDIGDDGLRLIERARRARAGAGEGN